MVKKGRDIRRLLNRRMETWKNEHFDELLFEFKRCSKHLKKSTRSKLDDSSHISKVFSHLMMKGQIRAAVRWITERTSKGGVLDASACIGSGSKTVLDVLKEKHPDPSQSSVDSFLPCNELPPLIEVDLTSCHIDKSKLVLALGALMLDIGKTFFFTVEHTVQSYVMLWQSWPGALPTRLLNGQTSKH